MLLQRTFRRTLRSGDSGEDVRELQELLRGAGYDPGPIDGVFGRRTEDAVIAFQRARGLSPDGAVGPSTLAALTATAPTGGPSRARGRSLHLGLNAVDNVAYGTQVPSLRGCHNDARDMMALAQAQGFTPNPVLLDAAATTQGVVAAISEAARDLQTGDFFFLTYSGHGSQMPDSTGEEPDQSDETWVLYDRQLLDDELYALWGMFQPGVRIFILSDSCHSGTVSRDVVLANRAFAAAYEDTRDVGFVLNAPRGLPLEVARDLAGLSSLRQSLRNTMQRVITQLSLRSSDVDRYVDMVLDQLQDDTRDQLQDDTRALIVEEPLITRNLPPGIAMADARARRDIYRDVKQETRQTQIPPRASVLLISGCQDNQVSLDGSRNGLFTQRLLETWDGGRFDGVGYPELHRRIVAAMGAPQQTPNLYWATPVDTSFEIQRPFTIA